jgi:molecular chaperone GrpE
MTEADRIEPTLDAGTAAPADRQPPQQPAGDAPQAANDADALSAAQAQIATLEAKVKELHDSFLRAQADVQNTRRRADDEMSKARKFAVESFAEAMLPVVDSLEAGLAHEGGTTEQIREGAEMTLRQLKSALERNKVVEINPKAGTRFDPHLHQAISLAPSSPGSPQEPNSVVSVLQKGYLIADRILRPALVTVTAPK